MSRRKSSAPSHSTDPALDRARDRLFATLHGAERYTLFADEVAHTFGVQREHALAALRAIRDGSAWSDGPLPGTRILIHPELAQRRSVIAQLPVGLHIPIHAHAERELTFVLDGELLDDGVRRVGPGELLDMPVGTSHSITVAGEHPCLAVFRGAPDRND